MSKVICLTEIDIYRYSPKIYESLGIWSLSNTKRYGTRRMVQSAIPFNSALCGTLSILIFMSCMLSNIFLNPQILRNYLPFCTFPCLCIYDWFGFAFTISHTSLGIYVAAFRPPASYLTIMAHCHPCQINRDSIRAIIKSFLTKVHTPAPEY